MVAGAVVKYKDVLFSSLVLYVQSVVITGVVCAHAGLLLVLVYRSLLIKPQVDSCTNFFGPLF